VFPVKVFVEELKDGFPVDSVFSVKYKRAVVPYANGYRFAFGAADRTGEVEVSYWGGDNYEFVQKVHDSFREGAVVRVKGFVGTYKERKKIDVNEGKGSVEPVTEFALADFIAKSEKDTEGLYKALLSLVGEVKHPGLRALLDAFFLDKAFAEEFKQCPGAMYIHHAWLGGLLEHSLAVALIAREAAKNYDHDVDLDLLTAGALLHDVGKTRELSVSTNIKVGEEGMLRGHTVIGEEMVREKARKAGLDERLLLKMSHMILAHHGEHEHGAPKRPMFVEAVLVYFADEMDAKASQFSRIRKETNTEDFRVYDRHWGEVYLR
jgi:3'-5' exoribonuclease